jgi:hypothetical protein
MGLEKGKENDKREMTGFESMANIAVIFCFNF